MLKRILSVAAILSIFTCCCFAGEIGGFPKGTLDDINNPISSSARNTANALSKAGFYNYIIYRGSEDIGEDFEELVERSKSQIDSQLELDEKNGVLKGEGKWPKVAVVVSIFHNQSHIEVYNTDKQYLSDEDIAAIKSCYDDTSLTAEERIENGDAALFSRLTKGMELTDNAEGEALIEKYKAIDPDFFAEKGGNTVIYIAAAAVIIVIAVFVIVRKSKKAV